MFPLGLGLGLGLGFLLVADIHTYFDVSGAVQEYIRGLEVAVDAVAVGVPGCGRETALPGRPMRTLRSRWTQWREWM